MRFASVVLALAATGFLAACNSEEACTMELVQKKTADLTTKITEVGTADPAKMAEMMPKLQELGTQAAAAGEDLTGVCKALDDMMAELNG